LTEDIDLGGSAQEVWTPIGTEEHPFKGNFNGDGHIIKELHINTPSADNLGLFGVNAGTIENLTVEGSLNGKDNIGGIAGTNTTEGTIKDCTSNVTVSGQNNVGGIVGKNEGTVTGCINKGDVTGSGTGVGGVAGTNLGALDNDRNTASVTGKDQVGGITGTNGENGTVQGCVNSGNVTGEEGSQPGAIIGNNQNQNSNGVKDDYYQKTETVNKDLTGIGQGTGAGTDPDGITSGEKETPGTEDEEKVAAAKKALQEALEKIIVSNDTSKEDIQSTVEKVLTNAGITGVTVSVDDFSKIEATTDAAGSISANIVLTDGSTTDTVEIAKTIEKLLVSGVSDVRDKINAIGEVTLENAESKKELIEAAREAYDKLTDEEKEEITPAEKKKLTDAEKLYDDAVEDRNQAAAAQVSEKINEIPNPVQNNQETKQKIEAAREAYDALTPAQKDMVPEETKKKLEDAEKEYNRLVEADRLAADEVKQKIEAIGEATPENVTSKKDLIEDAREAYDKLNEEQKELITAEEKKKLTDAEKLYDNATGGKNQAAADQAKQKIDAIPDPVKADWDSKSKIEAARDIYDSLTSAQKDMVPEASKKKLTDAEKIFRSLVSKADETAVLAVVNKVNAIGKVVKTDACGKKIKDARSGYNLLTQQQKKLFPPDILKKLTDAEQAYAELNKTPALPPEQQKQIEEIADKLGVSKKEAEEIHKVAKQLGVETDVLLVTDKSITGMKSENDVKGAVFGKLQVKCTKVTNKKITLKWKKVKGADGYLVYGTPCGKGKKPKLIKTLKKNSKTTFTQTKRKKGTPYRYIVRAYKLVGGKKITISIAKTVHVFTNGGKYTNAKSVKVNKTKVSIKKGKKFKLKATEVKANKKKKIRKHRVICYESTNKKIATVTKKGVIKGKKKGTCKIYVYTQNGVSKTVKVTVK